MESEHERHERESFEALVTRLPGDIRMIPLTDLIELRRYLIVSPRGEQAVIDLIASEIDRRIH